MKAWYLRTKFIAASWYFSWHPDCMKIRSDQKGLYAWPMIQVFHFQSSFPSISASKCPNFLSFFHWFSVNFPLALSAIGFVYLPCRLTLIDGPETSPCSLTGPNLVVYIVSRLCMHLFSPLRGMWVWVSSMAPWAARFGVQLYYTGCSRWLAIALGDDS